MDARVKAYSAFIPSSEQQGIRQPEIFAQPHRQPENQINKIKTHTARFNAFPPNPFLENLP